MQNQLLEQSFIDSACLSLPLPQQWAQLPAAALPKRLLQKGLQTLLLLLGLGLLSQTVRLPLPWAWLAMALLALMLVQLLLVPVQLRRCRYLLRQLDFMLQQGLFWRSAVLIPLCRVQHVTVSQGPLQKLFGLATLRVYSAGGTAAEIRLADIRQPDAMLLSEQLSLLIPSKASASAAGTPAATTEPADAAPAEAATPAQSDGGRQHGQ